MTLLFSKYLTLSLHISDSNDMTIIPILFLVDFPITIIPFQVIWDSQVTPIPIQVNGYPQYPFLNSPIAKLIFFIPVFKSMSEYPIQL